jgi:hypothetical protein
LPADLQRAVDEASRAVSSPSAAVDSALEGLSAPTDPISELLESAQVQPAAGTRPGPGCVDHSRETQQRLATRTYATGYVQRHLCLPVGHHALSRYGHAGDDFWVDFGEPRERAAPSGPGPTDRRH